VEARKQLSTYRTRQLIDAAQRHWEERQPFSGGRVEFDFKGTPYEITECGRKITVSTRSGERIASRYR
jgi:hypothetical protein